MHVLAMRLARTATVAGAVLTAGLAARAAAAQPAQPDPLAGFDAYVEQARRAWGVPGLAVGVVRNDSVVFLKGYGVRTLGRPELVGVHTLFANASTTKAFTAAVAATLVDAGRLRWDDRVVDRLPSFALHDAWVTRELTVRDLLSHQLGFGDPSYLWYLHPADSVAQLLPRIGRIPAQTSFRTRFAYNNIGYGLAGVVAGTAAGTSWDALVRTRFLDPLGMRDTRLRGRDLAGAADVATPHALVGDTLRPLPDWSRRLVDGIPAAGSMYSSVADMTRWIRFLLDSARTTADMSGGRRRLVSDTAFAALFTPQALVPPAEFYPTAQLTAPSFVAYGFGWFLQDYAGEKVAYHTGSIDGAVALVGLVPARRLGLIVFANRDHAELRHALLWRVIDAHRAADRDATDRSVHVRPALRDWSGELLALYARADTTRRLAVRRADSVRVRDSRPPLPLGRYAGAYSDSLYGALRIRVDSTTSTGTTSVGLRRSAPRLVLDFAPDVFADLVPLGGDAFRVVWRPGWMTPDVARFRIGADGRATDVSIGEDSGSPSYARQLPEH